jgi:diguanylate cyclase (GGDEF)-like protein
VRAAVRAKDEKDALAAAAAQDSLTGLLNRRQLDLQTAQAMALAERYRRPLACLMLDLDHFKVINDSFGHEAGDSILRRVGERLRRLTRSSDIVGRYGGDEFVVLLPETDLRGAVALAEKMQAAIAAAAVDATTVATTVCTSIGVAQWDRSMAVPAHLYAAADAALYRAKQLGRNRVATAPTGRPHDTPWRS